MTNTEQSKQPVTIGQMTSLWRTTADCLPIEDWYILVGTSVDRKYGGNVQLQYVPDPRSQSDWKVRDRTYYILGQDVFNTEEEARAKYSKLVLGRIAQLHKSLNSIGLGPYPPEKGTTTIHFRDRELYDLHTLLDLALATESGTLEVPEMVRKDEFIEQIKLARLEVARVVQNAEKSPRN